MPGITNPAEEYFKDGLWAWDPAGGAWLKLIIDPLTNRLVVDHPGAITVEQTTPGSLTPGVCGWDGAAWHKLPMVWGFSGTYSVYVEGTAVGAGNATATTVAVPPGYVYVVRAISYRHSAPGVCYCDVAMVGDEVVNLIVNAATTQDVYHCEPHLDIILGAGDTIVAIVIAPGDGEKIFLRVGGYKMKIAE